MNNFWLMQDSPAFFQVVKDSSTLGPLNVAPGEEKKFVLVYRIPNDAPPGCHEAGIHLAYPGDNFLQPEPETGILRFYIIRRPWERFVNPLKAASIFLCRRWKPREMNFIIPEQLTGRRNGT